MKPLERPASGRGLVVATGVVVALGCGAYAWMNHAAAPDATAGAAPTPITAQAMAPTAPSAATSLTSGAQLPATLPPGITLVSTVPNAQPPQATLLVDGRLQAQPLGSSVAGVGLKIREVTAEGITLGQQDGPPLYTLRITSAAETTRLMAEARAQRLAERQPTLVRPAGDLVVQRDADRAAALPDEMNVTVHRRQPVTAGPVGSL
jgi:hypothetical protein